MVVFSSSFTEGRLPIDREWFAAVQKTFVVIACTVHYHDYFLTLSREVDWVWRAPRQFSWLNAFFYFNRYLVFFGQAGVLLRAFWSAPLGTVGRIEMCEALTLYHQYFGIVVQLVVGAFMVVRVYALYNFNRLVLAFLLIAGLAVVANGVVSVCTSRKVHHTEEDIPTSSCLLLNTDYNAQRLAFSWAGLLVFDIITFLLTLRKALKEPAIGKSSIVRLLLRDGSLYFAVMTLMTIATVASFLLPQPYVRGCVTSLTNVVSSSLVTRLILNMRDPALCSQFTPAVQDAHNALSTVRWAKRGTKQQFNGTITLDLEATREGDFSNRGSGEEQDYNHAQERGRKERARISSV